MWKVVSTPPLPRLVPRCRQQVAGLGIVILLDTAPRAAAPLIRLETDQHGNNKTIPATVSHCAATLLTADTWGHVLSGHVSVSPATWSLQLQPMAVKRLVRAPDWFGHLCTQSPDGWPQCRRVTLLEHVSGGVANFVLWRSGMCPPLHKSARTKIS